MKSILELIDLDLLCEALNITDKEPLRIFDYGCADGTLLAAIQPRLHADSKLYGFDTSADVIEQAKAKNIPNAVFSSVAEELPIKMKSVDVCIMSRVFHEVVEQNMVKEVLEAVHRVIQGFGTLGVIEFKKNVKAPFGPPMQTKLSPGAVERWIQPEGFRHKQVYDNLGEYLYLTTFGLAGRF